MKPTIIENYEKQKEISDFLKEKLKEDILRKSLVVEEENSAEMLSKNSEFFNMWVKSNSVLYSIGCKIRDNSSVPTYLVRNIFSTLLTYVEGERFVPYTKYENDLFTFSIVVKETAMDKITNNEELESAIRNGDAIRLDNYNCSNTTFYNANCEVCYDVGIYNYAQEFIDYIVENNEYNKAREKEITDKEMENLLISFLKYNKKELVELNINRRISLLKETSTNETVKQLIKDCKKIDRKINKKRK